MIYTRSKIQETGESEVKSLNVYMFKKGAEASDADHNYTLLKAVEGARLNSDGNGSYSYIHEITDDMMGETLKIMLVANEKLQPGTEGVTTLEKMKESLAQVRLQDEVNADELVGRGESGFPMSCMALNNASTDTFKVVPTSLTLKGNLVRTVARLDLKNKTTNLTITDVRLRHAIDKSYLAPKPCGLLLPI